MTSATNVQSGLSNLRGNCADHVREILCGHLEQMYAFYGELLGVRIARKHRCENAAFRAVVNRAESADEQLRLTRNYFDSVQQPDTLAVAA